MATRSLDGPRLSPASGRAKQLVVLLHGYGADGNDLIDLAQHWKEALPDCAFVSPHAPEPCGMGGSGFQWFPLSRMDPAETLRGCEAAKPGLDAFLDAELARWRLGGESVALVGFSQGTMMALYVGLARKPSPAAIVGFSGMLVGADRQPHPEGIPPILLTHGDQDQVIPPQALFMSASALGRAGLPVRWHLAQGIGHGIDGYGLTLAGRFLFDAFAGRLRPRTVPASCNYPR